MATVGASADGVWRRCQMIAAPEAGRGLAEQLLTDAALVVEDGRIAWLGAAAQLPAGFADNRPQHDLGDALVTPGLVDCHTHLVYGGQRANEFAMRLDGATYEQIARAGGGIVSTVGATRGATDDQLFDASAHRLQSLLAEGVCAIEIKSGYGLSLEHEARQLRIGRRLGSAFGVTVRTTFLGAHALPPGWQGSSDDYIDQVCRTMLPALADEGLVDAVDVFCEHIAFSLAQTERVFQAAQRLGLPVKLHAEQLSDMGGSQLAARYRALSCDHLEHLSQAGVDAMAAAGTVAVLLPGAFYFLRDTRLPPLAALRAAGVPIAIATDHNPGTSPCLSLLLTINMACTLFRLTVPEALAGVTTQAARALGLADHGSLRPGVPANFVAWDVRDPAELAYWFGQRPVRGIVRQGRIAA